MTHIWNLRGTNGSGKSTLARAFINSVTGDATSGPVDLQWYDSPTKGDPARRKRAEGYGSTITHLGRVGVVGPYRTACGGMDALPGFAVCQGAIEHMANRLLVPRDDRASVGLDHIVAEGVLASTVWGSWGEFAQLMKADGHTFNFVYLTTPLDVCLERIRARQIASGKGEREIKTEQVADKVRAIAATRARALGAGFPVYDLIWPGPSSFETQLKAIMAGQGEGFRA